MNETPQEQVSTSNKQDLTPIRNEKGQIIAGTANPNGRPKGSRDFYTDFKEAIKAITVKDPKTGEALPIDEARIIQIGLQKMLKGDARFEGLYKDLLDRVYGKPKQTTELTGANGKDLIPETLTEEEKSRLNALLGK